MAAQNFHCVRFNPSDEEIFQTFLIPKLALPEDAPLPNSLIQPFDFYHFDPITADKPGSRFFPEGNFWYFVTRTRLNARSVRPNRSIRTNPFLGKWRKYGVTEKITQGEVFLGKKHTYDYLNQQNLKTGWRMSEYERPGNAFQQLVVVHLYYKTTLDQTLLDDQQHVQQGNEVHAHGNVVGIDDVVDHVVDQDQIHGEQIVNNQQQENEVHAHGNVVGVVDPEVEHHQIHGDVVEQQQENEVHAHGNVVGVDDLVDQEVEHHQIHGEQIVNNQNQAHGIVDDWYHIFGNLGDI